MLDQVGCITDEECNDDILAGLKTAEVQRCNRHLGPGQRLWLLQRCALKLGPKTCRLIVGHVEWYGTERVSKDGIGALFENTNATMQ